MYTLYIRNVVNIQPVSSHKSTSHHAIHAFLIVQIQELSLNLYRAMSGYGYTNALGFGPLVT